MKNILIVSATSGKNYQLAQEIDSLLKIKNINYQLIKLDDFFIPLYNPKIDNGIYSKELVYKHIVNRFIPDETQDEAIIHISSKMSYGSTYTEQVIDFFHHAAKKNSEEGYLKKMFNIF